MSDESLAGKNLKKSLSHIPYLQQDSIYSKRKIQIFSSNPVQLGAWPRRVCEHTAQGEGEKWHVSAPRGTLGFHALKLGSCLN